MMGAEIDRARLSKLLGLLGSVHDGEVAAAGRAADALVRRAGLTWSEVLTPRLLAPDQNPAFASVGEACAFCLALPDRLTDWEIEFCYSLLQQHRPLSPKQAAVLDRLVDKVRGCRT